MTAPVNPEVTWEKQQLLLCRRRGFISAFFITRCVGPSKKADSGRFLLEMAGYVSLPPIPHSTECEMPVTLLHVEGLHEIKVTVPTGKYVTYYHLGKTGTSS